MIIWLIALVVFIVLEIITPVPIVSIWFAIGSAVAYILSIMKFPLLIQLVAFAVVSFGLFGLTRPFVHRVIKPKHTPTNADVLIGQVGKVTEAIDPIATTGRVFIANQDWKARSGDNTPIPVDTLVCCIRIEGATAIVRPTPIKEG